MEINWIFKLSVLLVLCQLCSCAYLFEVFDSSDSDYNNLDADIEILDGNFTDLRYLLWTRANPGNDEFFELVTNNATNLAASGFNGSRMTYMMHPGWTSFGNTAWILDSKTSLLTLYDCNVISVDWGLVVPGPNYIGDVEKMYAIAMLNAQLIDWLAAAGGLSTSRLELTGHSLGGQSVGMTAMYTTAGRIRRVTGLDPAGPLFYNKTSDERLDKSDAEFVDIIHTNGCPFQQGCYGIGQELGHVDFWPNGGEHQAGCDPPVPGGDIVDLIRDCSHDRAVQYWVESLAYLVNTTNAQFTSWPCTDYETYTNGSCPTCAQGCLPMGFDAPTTSDLEGNFYLRTNSFKPYALGDVQ